jgi:hypothetical protein
VIRQAEQLGDLLRVVADGADGCAAEPHRLRGDDECRQRDAGIDGGIEERIEVVVGERLAAPSRAADAAGGCCRRTRAGRVRPGIHSCAKGPVESKGIDAAADAGILDDDDVALLQVALGRGRKRQCAQGVDQRRSNTARLEVSDEPRPASCCQLSGQVCGRSSRAISGSAAPNLCASVSRIFFMASSIDVTLAWVAAALSPCRRHLGDAGDRLVGQGQVDGLIALGR